NGTATGKTRLLYEGLCQHWGFYFTMVVDTSGLGANDIERTMAIGLDGGGGLVAVDLPPVNSMAFEPIFASNHRVAHRRFSAVLLSRLVLYRAGHLP
ncbi:hypothetical protein C8J56DRAFT_787189, partial [Mycena floridula]